jgi:hypothetical protein
MELDEESAREFDRQLSCLILFIFLALSCACGWFLGAGSLLIWKG